MKRVVAGMTLLSFLAAGPVTASAGGWHGGGGHGGGHCYSGWHGGGCGWPAFGIGVGVGLLTGLATSYPAYSYSYPTYVPVYTSPTYVYQTAPASQPAVSPAQPSNQAPPTPPTNSGNQISHPAPSPASYVFTSTPKGTWIQDPTPYSYTPVTSVADRSNPTVGTSMTTSTVSKSGSDGVPVLVVNR